MKLLTNKEIWIWILASLLVINLAATVTILWKQNKYEHKSYKKHDRDKTKDKIFKKGFTKWHESMGFTEEQTKNLKELRNEFKTNSEEIFSQLNENQRMIFLELDSDEPDLTRLDSLMEITGNIHTNLRRQSVDHMLKIKAIVNPEQYDQMLKMMKDWMFKGPDKHLRKSKHGCGMHVEHGCDKHAKHECGKHAKDDTCMNKKY